MLKKIETTNASISVEDYGEYVIFIFQVTPDNNSFNYAHARLQMSKKIAEEFVQMMQRVL